MAPPEQLKKQPLSPPVFDVTSPEEFARLVLEQSHQRLVVVDFWAEWCGPCRVLGPILEGLAQAADDTWCLAKVDIDALQDIAQTYQIRSIPAVQAFSKGQKVDEFVGALPEPQIRLWLERWIPGPEDEALAEGLAHEAAKNLTAARQAYERALEHKPLFAPAIVSLARVALASNQREEARLHLQSIAHVDDEALEQEIAQMQLLLHQENPSADVGSLLAQSQSNPDDLEVRLQLGHAYATSGQHEDALQTFLSIVEQTRTGPGEKAKEAMVQLFAIVGMHSELASRFRSALSRCLFS